MDFNTNYRDFLREYIDKKYLQQYNNLIVLAENFVDNYYVVLFETQEDTLYHTMPVIHRFILVENIEEPIIKELKALPHPDGYITMSKAELAKIVGDKLYNKLVCRGIATTKEIGYRKNNRFSWHRLVACIYYNCLDKEVHHINKVRIDNNIKNLIPLEKQEHAQIENLDEENARNLALDILCSLKAKLKRKRQTVANNVDLIHEILECSMCGYKTTKLIKKYRHYIKKSSIYEIVKKGYYFSMFLYWLQNKEQQAWGRLNGNSLKRWIKIIEFENQKYRL